MSETTTQPKIALADVTARQMVRSLWSFTCPACGGEKRNLQTLCGSCYGALKQPLGSNLYRRVGVGYEDAFRAALANLDVERITMPPATEGDDA